MTRVASAPLPQPGQLVVLRQRRYVVTDIQQSMLIPDHLRLHDQTPQHLVTLASVEDDALGEELQVIWEIEPGAQAIEQSALPQPDGFDPPVRFDAFLDAVRWGAIASADVRALQAPFRSGITPEDYQLDPVVRAIQLPRVNLLIADDVGLGKTIEAGLVIQELILRHRARTVLVVCPAALQIQWRDQMRDKFGLSFRIVDSELMRSLRRTRGLHVNPWSHYPRLITSIDFLKRERPIRLFREVLPGEGESSYPRRFDLLIVDEAHNVAPSGRGHYAADTMRTRAIRQIVAHFEHRLFLSATPHNGYPESFTALLELLDNQRFARGVSPDRKQLGTVMVRRLKSELPPRWDGTPRFPERQLDALEVDYTDAERAVHRTLQQYAQQRLTHVADQTERVASEFVLKLLKKRLLSSPEAFAQTIARHTETLHTARRKTARFARPAAGVLRQQIEQADEEFGNDDSAMLVTDDALTTTSLLFRALSDEEQTLLHTLQTWADDARGRPDSKAETLIRWLHETLKPGGQWNDERVILFTEYRDTQRWLQLILHAAGFADEDRLLVLYGGMATEQRESIKAAFQAAPAESAVRILLATDAASEGIDLQRHCHRLIHYEIPWNPNRMEQRNGRIDRHGQQASEVLIYHFVRAGWQQGQAIDTRAPDALEADLEFLLRAALKVNAIREDLGSVGPVIATQIEEAMLGQRRQLDTRIAEQNSEPVRRMLTFERKLRDQIARLREQLQEARRTLHLEPEHIQEVVTVALELAGQPPLREATLPDIWPDSGGQHTRCPVFHMPPLTGSWATCLEGLAHPHTGSIRPITFDQNIAGNRDDVVLAHLNHRLVQMSLRLLRAEVWASADERSQHLRLHRVTTRLVPSAVLETPAVIGHARLLLLGGDQQRLHEEVIATGGALREGRFARLNVSDVQRVLDAVRTQPVSPALQERLATQWSKVEPALLQSLEVRGRERAESLRRVLHERMEQEMKDITAILTELRTAILDELKQPEVEQLSLFSDPEREQFERNRDSLQARVNQIPSELEQETAAIRARYADPQARLFPVAVMFVVPEGLI